MAWKKKLSDLYNSLTYIMYSLILFEEKCVFPQRGKSLAGLAQWIECWTVKQKVTGLIPVRAHAWVAGQVPSRGCERSNHTLMFPFLSASLLLSLKINKIKSLKK